MVALFCFSFLVVLVVPLTVGADMALPTRSIVFCVCDSDCESNATAYSWALAHLFEPRDSLTFLFCRVQPTLVRK